MNEWREVFDTPDWREGGLVEFSNGHGVVFEDWVDIDDFYDTPTPVLTSGRSWYDFAYWRQREPSA